MERRIGRTFLILFVATLLFIFIVIKIFGHHAAPPKPTGPVLQPLPSYSSTDAQAIFTIDGPINGDDQHRAVRISVDQFQREIDIIGGYNGNIISQQTFPNNQTAYNVFLHALQNEGFTLKLKNATTVSETAQCPLGERTTYQLNDGGTDLSNLWTTSCGGKLRTLGGSATSLELLFQAQITNYNSIISKANVSF